MRKYTRPLALLAAGVTVAALSQVVADHVNHLPTRTMSDTTDEVWWTLPLDTAAGPIIIPDGVGYITHYWK